LKRADPLNRDFEFVDCGSGDSGVECAAQIALTYLKTDWAKPE